MAETIADLARIDEEGAIKRVMTDYNVDRQQAERLVAVALGRFRGDVYLIDEQGNETPLPFLSIEDVPPPEDA